MLLYVLAALGFLFSLLLSYAVGLIPQLHGTSLIAARIALVVLGIIAAALLIWLGRRRASAGTKGPDGKRVDTAALDDLLREANRKLAASPRAGARSLEALPLVYVLGDPSSAKTTVILKSGLDPELLAGQLYRDKDVIATPVANIWYSENAAIVEAGEALRTAPALWHRLIARTRPKAHRAAFSGAPFRAAVVCVSCEQFLGAQTTESIQAAAAATGERLRQLARQLGTQLPIYVLFTKLDRVPGFSDFVRNLSAEEAAELLGAVPDRTMDGAGLYAENATAGTAAAYDQLVFALAGARLEILDRETDASRLDAAYEFPRELRRFRNHLTAYLVELVRPSHLDSNPYLRGFYFTGVRAVVLQQQSAAAAAVRAPQVNADATTIFSAPAAAPQPSATSTTFTEKVAQWTFLPRFFPQVVLGDRRALEGTRQTHYAALFRRLLYGSIATALLVYLVLLSISYLNNQALERRIEAASSALAAMPSSAGGLASAQQLQTLDNLRTDLVRLEGYQQHGAPLSYRWGLYRGDLLLGPARAVYFTHFRNLLLNRTQADILAAIAALPPTPGQTPAPGADYNSIYAALRAYLITTSNPEKSTVEFLPPVLQKYWQNGATLESSDQQQLADRQFAFYSAELPHANPFSIAPAEQAVAHARAYLANFGGFERIYQSMLTAAEKVGPSINFNAQHPRSAETVIEPHIVPAAFTRSGFSFMQDALAHAERYFSGEAWVLGDQAPPSIDPGTLKAQLAARYVADYISQWRAFLKDAAVVRYRSLQDAGTKLTMLASNNSPLLALIYTVSQNTTVPNPEISAAFQAPQALIPGQSTEQYITPADKSYVDSLLALNSAISQVTQNPAGANDPAAALPVSTAAAAATLAAQQTAQAFHIDGQGHVDAITLALMEAPITGAQALVRGLGPAQANAGGKSFCSAFTAVFQKIPFNLKGTVQATPAEVSALLQPGTGALWQFYNANLKSLLVQQGAGYVTAPNPPMQVNPAFTRFFSRAAELSQEMFPPGATGPALTFMLRNVPTTGIESTLLRVDSQTLSNTETQKQFNWSAQTASQAGLTANNLPLTFNGTWAVFELFNKARVQKTGAGYELSFPLEVASTPVKAPDGTPLVVKYELSGSGADVLAPGALSHMQCVSNVAR